MAINLVTVMSIALTLVIMISGGCGSDGGVLVSSESECESVIPILAKVCQPFVGAGAPKGAPSGECCKAMRNIGIPCICRLERPEVSMKKVVYVARTCGVTVPPGTRCGSFTVPPS